jgi:hypothetical protein
MLIFYSVEVHFSGCIMQVPGWVCMFIAGGGGSIAPYATAAMITTLGLTHEMNVAKVDRTKNISAHGLSLRSVFHTVCMNVFMTVLSF